MISRIIFLFLTALFVTGCVDQPAAPIEYGGTNASNNSVNTNGAASELEQDEGIIIRKNIDEDEINEKTVGTLQEPEEVVEEVDDVITIPVPASNLQFIRPVEGKIITNFGEETVYGKSKGVDIAAKEGSSVKSIAAGRVVYSGFNKQFGNLIIVKLDSSDLYAAYANLKNAELTKGSVVAKGAVIGQVGRTGNTKAAQLHFAIRQGKIAVDPTKYVPLD